VSTNVREDQVRPRPGSRTRTSVSSMKRCEPLSRMSRTPTMFLPAGLIITCSIDHQFAGVVWF
jgi:hypothetical protein